MLSSQKDCVEDDEANNDISKPGSIDNFFHGITPFDQSWRWLILATALLFRGLFSLALIIVFVTGA